MTDVAWLFLVTSTVTGALMTIAIGGNANLAAENRRLRKELGGRRHPARRTLTLFTGGADDGGVA